MRCALPLRWTISITLAIVAFAAHAAEKIQRVTPERVANYWLLESNSAASANVPNSGVNLNAPSCAAVSYVIEKDGNTSHVKLEHLEPQGDLGKVAMNVVAGMHFAAAAGNIGKDAVATYVVIPFNLPNPVSTNADDRALRERILGACKLSDFGAKPQ